MTEVTFLIPLNGDGTIVSQEECCWGRKSRSLPSLPLHAGAFLRQRYWQLGRLSYRGVALDERPVGKLSAMVFSWIFGDVLEPLAKNVDLLIANPSQCAPLLQERIPRSLVVPAADCFQTRSPLPFAEWFASGLPDENLIYSFSSGCPWRCPYCVWSHDYRLRDPGLCAAEINLWASRNQGLVHLLGNEITGKSSWLKRLCDALASGVAWHSDANVRNLTEEDPDLEIARDAGCQRLCFGIEALSNRLLEKLNKGHTVEQALRAFEWCQELGIAFRFSLRQYVSETPEDLRETLDTLLEMDRRGLRPAGITIGPMVRWPGVSTWQADVPHGSEWWPRYVRRVAGCHAEEVRRLWSLITGVVKDLVPA